jgi:hypothetical protein
MLQLWHFRSAAEICSHAQEGSSVYGRFVALITKARHWFLSWRHFNRISFSESVRADPKERYTDFSPSIQLWAPNDCTRETNKTTRDDFYILYDTLYHIFPPLCSRIRLSCLNRVWTISEIFCEL